MKLFKKNNKKLNPENQKQIDTILLYSDMSKNIKNTKTSRKNMKI